MCRTGAQGTLSIYLFIHLSIYLSIYLSRGAKGTQKGRTGREKQPIYGTGAKGTRRGSKGTQKGRTQQEQNLQKVQQGPNRCKRDPKMRKRDPDRCEGGPDGENLIYETGATGTQNRGKKDPARCLHSVAPSRKEVADATGERSCGICSISMIESEQQSAGYKVAGNLVSTHRLGTRGHPPTSAR